MAEKKDAEKKKELKKTEDTPKKDVDEKSDVSNDKKEVLEEKLEEKPTETPASDVEKKPLSDDVDSEALNEEPKKEDDNSKKSDKKSLKEKIIDKKEKGKSEVKKEKIEADENGDGLVSAREAINSIDSDIKITEKSEDEIIADHVAQQLEEKADYFVFRIRKSIFLMVSGLVVLLLWVIPLAPFLKNKLNLNNLLRNEVAEEQAESTSPTPTPVEEVAVDKIRIRASENTDVASVSALLSENGYSEVDIQRAEVEDDGISIAVKKDGDELREKLISILEVYSAGSSSSELTVDSDFSALIIMGE